MKFAFVLAAIPFIAFETVSVAARASPNRGEHHRGQSNHLERGGQNNNNFRGGRFQPPPRNQNHFGQRPGGNNNNNNQGGANGNKGVTASSTSKAVVASSSSSAAASTISANKGTGFEAGGGNNNNNKGVGAAASTTTTAAAAAATTNLGTPAPDNSKKVSPNDPSQSSLQLDPSQIGPNLAQNGQAVQEAGQVPSITSKNNYINFCKTTGQPITNGLQQTGGSCNPVPQGQIPAKNLMPACKFVFPPNLGTVKANTNFTIQLATINMATGQFVNPNINYFSGPQQLNPQGKILGHNHFTIQALKSLQSTEVLDPQTFTFFKGANLPDKNGILSADVTGGLPAGFYQISSITTSSNHVPVLGPIAQHGTFDAVSYFTVQ